MTDELTLLYETEIPIPMTCADGTGIERGTILSLADPYTVAAATTNNQAVGGVAAEEKIASDGKTKISVYRGGIFKAKISGSVTVGDALVISGNVANNLVETAAVNDENVLGIALETGTTGETIMIELNPTVMQLA